MLLSNALKASCLISLSVFMSGCESTYYAAMEKVGIHKREILIDRVEDARDSQLEAQEQFNSALEYMQSLTNFDGGELQATYEQVAAQYADSKNAANDVSAQIQKIADVADALFEEWQTELDQYQSNELRQQSQRQLRDTQKRYDTMLSAMQRAEAKMAPVLNRLKDNELYLKHNLNARAIGAVSGQFNRLEGEVASLIKEMEKAISESNNFINQLR